MISTVNGHSWTRSGNGETLLLY